MFNTETLKTLHVLDVWNQQPGFQNLFSLLQRKGGGKKEKKKKAHIQFKTFVAYIQLEAFAEANLCSF